jgi:hypothetical protein
MTNFGLQPLESLVLPPLANKDKKRRRGTIVNKDWTNLIQDCGFYTWLLIKNKKMHTLEGLKHKLENNFFIEIYEVV